MKTKLFIVLAALSFATAAFAQETKTMYVMKDGVVDFWSAVSDVDSIIFYKPVYDPLFDEGVIINGVKWATRNVSAPGTFADYPENAGMFYQWNRKVAWPATGSVSGWDNSDATGTEWEKANDPSPAGWRVPTLAEIQTLLDGNKVSYEWTTVNGVSGRRFTDKTSGNSIFLPAAGYRDNDDGTLYDVDDYGNYWGRTQYNSYRAYYLYFGSGNAYWGWSWGFNSIGFSVRPVAEN